MLIKCPECNHDVSSSAASCPNCGYIINNINQENDDKIYDENGNELVCPEFPEDLDLGKSINAFTKSSFIFGKDDNTGNSLTVIVYNNGLKIMSNRKIINEIHKSQLINMKQLTKQEMITQNKSIVGRAIVGGILTGGFGAVVGGMTGLNTNKMIAAYYFVINYWDINTKKPKSIIIHCDKNYNSFIDLYKQKVQDF